MIREIEFALALEASAYAAAAADLNPFGEAESLELGNARAVYSGQWSPVHGVFGLGLDGAVEANDLREIEQFFLKKERPAVYWVTSETDPSLLELLGRDFEPSRKIAVHGLALKDKAALPEAAGESRPDHKEWSLAFTQVLDSGAKEPGLFALTKLHQKDSRYYLGASGGASYTFFARGIALAPVVSANSLLALQVNQARDWGATFFASGASPLPLIYERTLYERL